jgi:trehalose-6-phosphatase
MDLGIVAEEKTYSVPIHYRNVRDKLQALATIKEALCELTDVRIVEGLYTVNLLRREGPHKGVALQRRGNSLLVITRSILAMTRRTRMPFVQGGRTAFFQFVSASPARRLRTAA